MLRDGFSERPGFLERVALGNHAINETEPFTGRVDPSVGQD
jgi:hypothetical protein